MKSSLLNPNVEYAVIPAWEYSSQDKKDPLRVQRNHVAKAKLVSLKKYEYKVYRSNDVNDPAFELAQQGSRTVGYLVESDTWVSNGQSKIVWLARPQDIVEAWSVLEPRWAEAERLEREQQARQQAEREKAEEERRLANEKRERIEKSMREALAGILGNRVTENTIRFETNNMRIGGEYKSVNVVSIEMGLVETLIEKVLEAKDLVG